MIDLATAHILDNWLETPVGKALHRHTRYYLQKQKLDGLYCEISPSRHEVLCCTQERHCLRVGFNQKQGEQFDLCIEEQLPFKPNAVDGILLYYALHCLTDRAAAKQLLKQAFDSLDAQGQVRIIQLSNRHIWQLFAKHRAYMPKHIVSMPKLQDIIKDLKSIGFAYVTVNQVYSRPFMAQEQMDKYPFLEKLENLSQYVGNGLTPIIEITAIKQEVQILPVDKRLKKSNINIVGAVSLNKVSK